MNNIRINTLKSGPDENGRFGDFGGMFVSETLMPLILQLNDEYENAKTDPKFWAEMWSTPQGQSTLSRSSNGYRYYGSNQPSGP